MSELFLYELLSIYVPITCTLMIHVLQLAFILYITLTQVTGRDGSRRVATGCDGDGPSPYIMSRLHLSNKRLCEAWALSLCVKCKLII